MSFAQYGSVMMAVFIASFLGSIHCAGMCGPLAVIASGSNGNGPTRRWPRIALYHLGRVLSYAGLGAIAGFIGASIHWTGTLVGIQQAAATFAGFTMIVIGLLGLVALVNGQSHRPQVPLWLQPQMKRAHDWARKLPVGQRSFAIGILTSLLPCGWLYVFLLVAAGTANVFLGLSVMASFALGSVPILSGIAAGVHAIFFPLRKATPWLSSVLVLAVGVYTISQRAALAESIGRIELDSTSLSSDSINLDNTQLQIQKIDHQKLPCCTADE